VALIRPPSNPSRPHHAACAAAGTGHGPGPCAALVRERFSLAL